MLECIDESDAAARAVTEQEHRQAGFTFFSMRHDGRNVTDIVRKLLHVEALTVRMSAPAQLQCVDSETAIRELLCGPCIVTAVGVEAGNQRDHTADLSRWTPESDENPETAYTFHSGVARTN